jgi:hypothetical protein
MSIVVQLLCKQHIYFIISLTCNTKRLNLWKKKKKKKLKDYYFDKWFWFWRKNLIFFFIINILLFSFHFRCLFYYSINDYSFLVWYAFILYYLISFYWFFSQIIVYQCLPCLYLFNFFFPFLDICFIFVVTFSKCLLLHHIIY